jgi:bleomycin hydrolase
MSFIESEAHRLGHGDFELSEMYNVYNTFGEKAERYVRMHGNNTFAEGGLFHDVLWVLRTYGAVRDSDYPGIWPDEKKFDHSELVNVLTGYLDGVLKAGSPTERWGKGFQAILDTYLGTPPDKIIVNGVEMTPREFLVNILQFNPDDYIEFTSFANMPFYSRCELEIPDNWAHFDGYINVPLDDFMAIFDYALENGFTVAIGGDVSEKTYSQSKWGYGIVEADKEDRIVSQEERDKKFNNWTSTDDHSMHTVGYGTDAEGNRYYYTKNSWGTEDQGPYKGYSYFSANYIRAKMNTILVHKDAVPAEIKAKIKLD